MTDTQAGLGRMLLKGLVSLKDQKGAITLEDVGAMFVQMSDSHHSATSQADEYMHKEIHNLAQYIIEAKKEIFAIATNEKSEAALVDASQHLDEVIKATEEATHAIMDAADAIQQSVGGVGGDKEKQIMDATHRIYEACNFQDITGQRINKVIKLLANIDERVARLNALFDNAGGETASNVMPMTPPSDRDLLNGPQLSAKASSQEEIDLLFASLGGKK